jgi:phosphonate transport system substrate-binding protein
MKRRLFLSVLTASVASAALWAGALPRETPFSIAVLPCTDIEATFRRFHPLIEYLKQSAGVAVRLVVPRDLAEFEALLRNGQVDAALQDPHTYARLAHYFDGSTLLGTVGTDGRTVQAGVLVVRKDSGVTRPAQLRGRAVMFGPRTSTAKWVAARMLFDSEGIDPDRDLKIVNGGCCEDIAFVVAIRSVDAGVICEHFMNQREARQGELGLDADALRIIARTPAFPMRAFAARQGAPAAVVAAVIDALLRLNPRVPDQGRILSSAEISGFRRASEAEYLQQAASLPVR